MKKRMQYLALCGALIGSSLLPSSAMADEIGSTDLSLVINGQSIQTNASIGQPYITTSGRTMLPLRLVGETLQCDVTYEEDMVYLVSESNNFSAAFQYGEDYFFANNQRIDLDTPMVISAEGRSYVPARALMEIFGTISWDNATRTVSIDTGDWNLDDETSENTSGISIEGTSMRFDLEQGSTVATSQNLYLYMEDSSAHVGAYLSVPDELADWFTPENRTAISLINAKLVNGQPTVGIAYTLHPASDFTMEVVRFNGSSLQTGGSLDYIGTVVRSSDYTMDDTHLYSTDGLSQGPFSVEPNTLYIAKIGDPSSRVSVDVGFAINECTLHMDGDTLVAVDLDGIEHEVDVQALLAEAE